MHDSLIILTLIASVFAHLQNGTRASAYPTEEQVNLANGVLKEQRWPNPWFDLITDEREWMHIIVLFHPVIRPEPTTMVKKIPLMMGCDYGLRLNWFLCSAVHVIGECNDLPGGQDVQTGDCWGKLKSAVERGLFTTFKVISTLAYVHSVANDDVDLDEFYRSLVPIRNFHAQQEATGFSGVSLNGIDFGRLLNKVAFSLHGFLTSNCRPEYKPFDLERLMNEHERQNPTSYSYNFFVNKIDDYVGYINDHLTQLGFHYDADQDKIIFDPNQTPRWLSKSRFIHPSTS